MSTSWQFSSSMREKNTENIWNGGKLRELGSGARCWISINCNRNRRRIERVRWSEVSLYTSLIPIPISACRVGRWRNYGTTNILSGAKPECWQGLQLVLITGDITPTRLEIEGEWRGEVVGPGFTRWEIPPSICSRATSRCLF